MLDYSAVIENSHKFENSNISNALIPLYKDELNETGTVTGIASYKRLLTDVIKRYQTTSPIEYITSVIPTLTPSGKVFSFGNRLSGKQSQNTVITDNLKIFKLDAVTGLNENDVITNGTGGSATVLFIESPFVLVKITAGVFTANDSIGALTLQSIYNAVHMLGTLLPSYVGEYLTSDEIVTDYKQIDFQFGEKDIECNTKKGATGLTLETIKDLIAVFGIKYRPMLIEMLSSVMKTVELNEMFRYQRANAYARPNIVLTNSYGTNSSISLIYEDIWNRINQSIGSIGTNTGIAGNYSVSASSKVVGALKTVLKGDIYEDEGILYLPGGIPLIEDGYSLQDYLVVSLIGPDKNSATIFTPYDLQVVEVQNHETFNTQILVMDRFDIVDNPLVTRVNDQAKNEMMEITYIDNLPSLTNEF